MNSLPLVSISVSSYNNGKFIVETLNSIRDQTYSNIELVIIDDCSKDDSIKIIDEWILGNKARFTNVVFVKNIHNKGVCGVANQMILNSSGVYASIIASDDIMMPDKTRVQVDILESSAADVCGVYSDAYLIKEDGSPRYGWFIQTHRNFEELPSGNIYDDLMVGNFLPGMALLVKLNCYREVGLFDQELQYEDYDMWLRLAKKYKFIASDYVSAKYRIRANSLNSTYRTWTISNIKIYIKHVNDSKIAIQHLENISKEAFLKNDLKSLELLSTIKEKSSYINNIIRLWNLHLPMSIKRRIFYRLKLKYS